MSDGGGAYGAGRASGKFNPIEYIKKPEVILRFVGWIFSIVVFGCVATTVNAHHIDLYYYNYDAANFAIAVGVISFIGLIAFLVADAFFDNLSNIQHRKYVVIADVCFSCAWSFMWLVCFSYLTDMFRRSSYKNQYGSAARSTAEAPLAFAFFCLCIYIALSVLAILKLRQGISEDFSMPSSQPPSYSENPGTTPSNVPSVYTTGDVQFSPHPFAPEPAPRSTPGSKDAPAY